jgi:hypothetical protein
MIPSVEFSTEVTPVLYCKSDPTSERGDCLSVTKTNRLSLISEIISVFL